MFSKFKIAIIAALLVISYAQNLDETTQALINYAPNADELTQALDANADEVNDALDVNNDGELNFDDFVAAMNGVVTPISNATSAPTSDPISDTTSDTTSDPIPEIVPIAASSATSIESSSDLICDNPIEPAGDCAIIYQKCNYQGCYIEICEQIPKFEEFEYRSVYVPEGKEVHLWTGSNFQNEKTRFTHTIQCTQDDGDDSNDRHQLERTQFVTVSINVKENVNFNHDQMGDDMKSIVISKSTNQLNLMENVNSEQDQVEGLKLIAVKKTKKLRKNKYN